MEFVPKHGVTYVLLIFHRHAVVEERPLLHTFRYLLFEVPEFFVRAQLHFDLQSTGEIHLLF